MISKLEIKNLKGIQQLAITDFSRFNLIIGKNDAGKSTLLEAIYAFKAPLYNPPTEFVKLLRLRGRNQHARDLWYNYNPSSNPTIALTFNEKHCSLQFRADHQFSSVEIDCDFNSIKAKMKLNSTLNGAINGNTNINTNNIEGTLREGLLPMIFADSSLGTNTNQWEKQVDFSSGTDEYDGSYKDLSFYPYAINDERLVLKKNETNYIVDGLGDGHKLGLALLKTAEKLKNSIILIEEIETHHHPSSLKTTIDKLVKICIDNKNQVFITTHSPEVLQLFSKFSDTRLFHMQKTEDQKVLVNQIMPQDIDMIRDIGWDIGNLLKFEKLVIVEGEIDPIILRYSFKKIIGHWPEEIGINIIYTGGFTNQKELVKAVAINEKNVFLLRDYDDKTEADIKTQIFNEFKELESKGYTRYEDTDKILLTHNSGAVKKLVKDHVFVIGMPAHFTSIRKHAIEDYLLYMIQKDPSVISKVSPVASTVIPAWSGVNSKEVLENIFGRYNSTLSATIIKEIDVANFPTELKSILDKIKNS